MSTEDNKEIVERIVNEVWNMRKLALAAEIYAPDFVNHDPALPGVNTLEEFGAWFTHLVTAIPDFHVTIEDMIAEGDKVAKRWTGHGTLMGEYMGNPPTGIFNTLEGTTTYRLAGGKVMECWWSYDPKDLRARVSTLPLMEPAAKG